MKQLATISILTTDRQASSKELNQLLTDNGHIIKSRLGVNVQPTCVEHCTGLIVLALEAESEAIAKLAADLNAITMVKAELTVLGEQ